MIDVVELASTLIRYKTSTGCRKDWVETLNLIKNVLRDYCHNYDELYLIEPLPDREPILYMRFKGRNSEHPLLLHGHIDTVEPDTSEWEFGAYASYIYENTEINKKVLYGVGALDMKGGIAMMVCAIEQAINSDEGLENDVILCITSDEEEDSWAGSRWLVDNRPELFKGVKYALSELGGYPLYVKDYKFYMIPVEEKIPCQLWITLKKEGLKHAAISDNYWGFSISKVLKVIGYTELNPPENCNSTNIMERDIVEHLKQDPEYEEYYSHNSITDSDEFTLYYSTNNNLCVIEGLEDIFKIPSTVRLGCNLALMPSQDPKAMETRIKNTLGIAADDVDTVKIEFPAVYQKSVDEGLLPLLKQAITAVDPDGIPIPCLNPAFTDANVYSKLGIQTYGFTPMNFPKGFDFMKYIHAPNEQVPIDCLYFGVEVLTKVLTGKVD